MKHKFNPSINIIRDVKSDLYYLSTANSENAIERINVNITNGFKCFYLVGSYGTGKSSFLLALQKHHNGAYKYFRNQIRLNHAKKYEFVNIIGEYRPFQETLFSKLKINSLKDLEKYNQNLLKQNKALIILVDEFGKFLEFASRNNPEKELYFIQTLAEYVNDPLKNIIIISTVHQSLDSYHFELEQKHKREWEKVKGRLKEILFNEPIEQLLYLASRHIEGKNYNVDNSNISKLLNVFKKSSLISANSNIDLKTAIKLYPLDLVSVIVLTKALQDFGQNERSLFTFLQSNESYGLDKLDRKDNPFYNLFCVYKYLINDFYSVIYSKYNPDYIKWMNIKNSVERVETLFGNECLQHNKVVVTIGLLNIFAQKGAQIDDEFLFLYGKYSLGINNTKYIINELREKKLIRYSSYKKTYVLFEGTDIDLDFELNKAEKIVSLPLDITSTIKQYIDLPYIQANSISVKKGTPRFFEYRINEIPIKYIDTGESDGIINLIVSRKIKEKEVIELSKNSSDPILYIIYKNVDGIERVLLQIEKINYLLRIFVDDQVALKELKNMREYYTNELNSQLIENLFYNRGDFTWIYNGKSIKIHNRRELNEQLSKICEYAFPSTPTFCNELINRFRLPAPITTARRNLLVNLINNWEKEDLGFPKDKYPPEYSIYLSLLKNTGIHRKDGINFILGNPKSNESFNQLWEVSESFLESAKNGRKNILSFYEILSKKPFKLKKGFLDFWILIYLIIKKDDFALFDKNGYIPILGIDTFDLICKNPNDFYVKTFDVKGIKLDIFNKYREIINRSTENKFSNKSFIETIKPFLLFYKNLPEYAKKTNGLSKNAVRLRETIANAKEPEKTFFEDFPNALGFNLIKLKNSSEEIQKYVNTLQITIKEIRESYSNLVNRVENNLIKIIGSDKEDFEEYRKCISDKLITIKTHLLNHQQKLILSRIKLEHNDREGWLSSLVNSILGKPLNSISDEEEKILYDKMSDSINELFNLVDITKLEKEGSDSDIIKLELTTLKSGTRKVVINIPKNGELKIIEREIRKYLTEDYEKNQKVLIKLLNEQFDKEK